MYQHDTHNTTTTPGYLLLALGEYVSDLDGLKQTGLRKYLDRNTVDVRYTDDESGIGRLVIQPYSPRGGSSSQVDDLLQVQ